MNKQRLLSIFIPNYAMASVSIILQVGLFLAILPSQNKSQDTAAKRHFCLALQQSKNCLKSVIIRQNQFISSGTKPLLLRRPFWCKSNFPRVVVHFYCPRSIKCWNWPGFSGLVMQRHWTRLESDSKMFYSYSLKLLSARIIPEKLALE